MLAHMQDLIRAWRRKKKHVPSPIPHEPLPWGDIATSIPDPLMLIDHHKDISWANDAARRRFSITSEGRNLLGLFRNPDLIEALDQNLAIWVDLGEIDQSAFFVHLQPLGKFRLLFFRDVTEAKNIDRLRRDFIANVSHELKTPLTALGGFIETLRGPAAGDAEAQERFLAVMAKQVLRMQRLVQDLLSLSRIEMNEHLPITKRVNLHHIIHTAIDLVPGAKIFTQKAMDYLPETIPGEEEELIQVVANLLDNALKYGAAPYEIRVVATEDSILKAQFHIRPEDPLIALAIIDHGPGIEASHLPRLTERFYRADRARSLETGGTGLGLAIVKHILARHRGGLVIESEIGKGSQFICYLPG